jgi:voltage-gated potassium channel
VTSLTLRADGPWRSTISEDVRARPPVRQRPALQALSLRIGLAVALLFVVAITVLAGRAGYVDETGGPIGLIDALYYASVTTTTTGYGDITPVTSGTRLATLLIITPARVAFLLIVVGTTVELLTNRWREDHRRDRWRRKVHDHYVICGYGVKGRSAVRALREDGIAADAIAVVEPRTAAAEQANADGYTVIAGDASETRTLVEARIGLARAVIVAASRDDTSVLITLTARELAPEATIVAAVREQENAHLLRQSGADAVIISSETSGRLLGVTSRNPRIAAVVTDLLHTAQGLALEERAVTEAEVGLAVDEVAGMVLAVVRDGALLRYDHPACTELRADDRLLGLFNGDTAAD